MSAKVDAAIDALVDALAELPEHELEFWQRGNRVSFARAVRAEPALSRSGAGDRPGSPQVGLSALPAPPGTKKPRRSGAKFHRGGLPLATADKPTQ